MNVGNKYFTFCNILRVIDVVAEWRASNEKDSSRVGGTENALLNGIGLSTLIVPGTGSASFDEHGVAHYQNRPTVSGFILTFGISFIHCTNFMIRRAALIMP